MNQLNTGKQRFSLGTVYLIPTVGDVISLDEALSALRRHRAGDWGDVGKEGWDANEKAVCTGGRIFSVW